MASYFIFFFNSAGTMRRLVSTGTPGLFFSVRDFADLLVGCAVFFGH